ncbi:MAG: outer membrane protein assembly factor BamD [Gemmatimonadota bacterium]|nr:outer membrane protein assembly factor BamD [Gemmatimonadota bacterium]MDE2872691.1 outer membrane protein assembly factor BamD [Gemmatimonadota bacterium]
MLSPGRPRHSHGVVRGLLVGLLGTACSTAPPYTGWTPEQLYEHGQRAYDEGDWREARRAFERLVLNFPGYDRAVEARHYLARALFEDEEYLSAVAEYTRITQLYPDDQRSARAWMGLCHSYAAMSPHPERDQQYTVQARNTCHQVAGDFQGKPIGDSAAVVARDMHNKLGQKEFGVGQWYFQRKIYESAEHVFCRLLEDYPDTDAAPTALARLSEIYDRWGWDDDREEARAWLLRTYPESPEARALDAVAPSDSVPPVGSRAPPGQPSPPQCLSGGG